MASASVNIPPLVGDWDGDGDYAPGFWKPTDAGTVTT